MLSNSRWDAIVRFCHTATNRSNGIAVTTDRDGVSNGIFKSAGLEEGHQCLRDSILAGFAELVGCPDSIQREVHRIIVLVDTISNLQNAATSPRHVDSNSGRLCTFESFWVVMCYLGDLLGKHLSLGEAIGCKDSSTFSKTVIWLWIVGKHPLAEFSTVSAIWVVSAYGLHAFHGVLGQVAVIRLAHQNCLS